MSLAPLAEASLGFNGEGFHPDNIVDRGGFEPPTSPSLDFFAKGLDGFNPYPTRLDDRPFGRGQSIVH
jgi:hypothetical protein